MRLVGYRKLRWHGGKDSVLGFAVAGRMGNNSFGAVSACASIFRPSLEAPAFLLCHMGVFVCKSRLKKDSSSNVKLGLTWAAQSKSGITPRKWVYYHYKFNPELLVIYKQLPSEVILLGSWVAPAECLKDMINLKNTGRFGRPGPSELVLEVTAISPKQQLPRDLRVQTFPKTSD